MIGNSSSGILEMPIFAKPTINIGDRQKGRLKSNGITDVSPRKLLIKKAIDFIYSKRLNSKNIIKSYKKKNTSKKIVSIIKNINLEKYKKKFFYDILS
jgi:UDP-N-acetylglucosamine 2-epimerase